MAGKRPKFALDPQPNQESVWDYPRPPEIREDRRVIEVRDGDTVIAWSNTSFKVMETASPPTFYLPRVNVKLGLLTRSEHQTYCEFKGAASYWALERSVAEPIAWSYEQPQSRFQMLKDYIAFYPNRVDCFLGGERVIPQAGPFYGGWITSEIVGPFKGEPGTGHW
ncbi:MAG: DUF427 domain-containing protein [Pseudomonadota bacterium]